MVPGFHKSPGHVGNGANLGIILGERSLHMNEYMLKKRLVSLHGCIPGEKGQHHDTQFQANFPVFPTRSPFILILTHGLTRPRTLPGLGESWQLGDYIAAGIMAFGVWILMKEHHRHMHGHTEMDHDHVHTHSDSHHAHYHEEEVTDARAHAHRHISLHHDHPHVADLHHRQEHAREDF